MAYDPKSLSVLAYANGFTQWHYTTTDKQETVTRKGYFNPVADMMKVGDAILTNIEMDSRPTFLILWVSVDAEGVVTTRVN